MYIGETSLLQLNFKELAICQNAASVFLLVQNKSTNACSLNIDVFFK